MGEWIGRSGTIEMPLPIRRNLLFPRLSDCLLRLSPGNSGHDGGVSVSNVRVREFARESREEKGCEGVFT